MFTKLRSFFITLTSNTSLDLYPQNTLSRFTAKLPVSLDFKSKTTDDCEWYVGISKFACTKIERKIKKKSKPKIIFVEEKEFSNVDVLVKIKKPKSEYEITDILILQKSTKVFEIIKNENFFDRYTKGNVTLPVYEIPKNYVKILVDSYHCKVSYSNEYTMRDLFDTIFEIDGQAAKS